MNPDRQEILAAWIVAIAFIGVTAGQAVLPEAPPRLGYGVVNLMPRPNLDGLSFIGDASDIDRLVAEWGAANAAEALTDGVKHDLNC